MSSDSLPIGKIGEDYAVMFLNNKGYKIIDRNIRFRNGELDIVATDKNNTLVFVEVKTRKSDTIENAYESIGTNKINFLIRSAQMYLSTRKSLALSYRIDAISVLLDKENNLRSIEQIESITSDLA